MSWQDYIDTQLVGRELKEAVIAGHDGKPEGRARCS